MTPTTPDPADGDAMKAREIDNASADIANRYLDRMDFGACEELKDYIAAALRQARQDGARVQMDLICDFLIRTTNDGDKYASAIRSGFPVDK